MKSLFKNIIKDFIDKDLSFVKNRDYEIPINISKIVSIIGARRTGKTFILFSIIKKLRESVSKENLIYLNFEDDRLFPLKIGDLNLIIEAYFELFPAKKSETVYFFFDEVQNVLNWELFIRRVYDTENCRIYITGSSSKLLSKEIATSLRGRALSYTIFPYSFKEYLNFNNISFDVNIDMYSSAKKAKIINLFNSYSKCTSFPELIDFDASTQNKALHDYFDLIIYKDLVERFNISNHFLVKYFVKFLLVNISNPVSINKCFNDFKSQGVPVSKSSLFQYLDHISDAFVVYPVQLYSDNLREKQRNPIKIYSIDIGLNQIFTNNINIGRILENLVFLELKRRYDVVFYYKKKQEVDFLVEFNHAIKIFNVSYDLSDRNTLQREVSGLLEAMSSLGINKAILLTSERDEIIQLEDKYIHIIPFWKWFLLIDSL
ncbi:MAG: ATP-binding protein [Bacteroidota bacterium]